MTTTGQLADLSLDASRAAIARLVPDAMDRAVASYRRFVGVDIPLDAREFKEHHTAGRTALAHLEALLRLARWAARAGDAQDGSEDFETMLEKAGAAVAALRGEAP